MTTDAVARTDANLFLDEPVIDFDESASACRLKGFTAAHRTDPFWSGWWGDGAQASWLNRSLVQRLAATSRRPATVPDMDVPIAEAVADVADPGNRQRHTPQTRRARLRALAAVQMWRTVSAEQLAAFTGSARAAGPVLLTPAFRAGLVERGSLLSEITPTRKPGLNHLYRPIDNPVAVRELADHLNYSEMVALTAGHGWTRGPQNDRHNVLAAELALRVAEFCQAGAVLGESVSNLALLATDRHDPAANSRADGTIVRSDGLRIAIELTSSIGVGFSAKVRHWARVLDEAGGAGSGLAVVFVDASTPDRTGRLRKGTFTSMRAEVGRAAYEIPGAVRRGVPERMAVARWEWWFPRPNAMTASFLTLRAERPTGPPARRWESVHLLDIFDLGFDPTDPRRFAAAADNARGLWGVPSWMQAHDLPDFSGFLLRERGFAGGLTLPTTAEYRAARRSTAISADDWLTPTDDGSSDDWLAPL